MLYRIGMMTVLLSVMFTGGSPIVPVALVAIGASLMYLGRRTA